MYGSRRGRGRGGYVPAWMMNVFKEPRRTRQPSAVRSMASLFRKRAPVAVLPPKTQVFVPSPQLTPPIKAVRVKTTPVISPQKTPVQHVNSRVFTPITIRKHSPRAAPAKRKTTEKIAPIVAKRRKLADPAPVAKKKPRKTAKPKKPRVKKKATAKKKKKKKKNAKPELDPIPDTILEFRIKLSNSLNEWFDKKKTELAKSLAIIVPLKATASEMAHFAALQKIARDRFDCDKCNYDHKHRMLLKFCTKLENGADIPEERRVEILRYAERTLSANPGALVQIMLHNFDKCTVCDQDMVVVDEERVMMCYSCGLLSSTLDPSGQSTATPYSNMDKNIALVSCKRMNKMKDAIKQLSARHKAVVPHSIVINVIAHLVVKMRITNMSKVKYVDVLVALNQMNLKNFSDYCAQIYARIIGCSSMRVSPQQEQTILAMFAAIEDPWDRLKPHPSSSFLNTTLVLMTFCKFLGYGELLPYLKLSKTRVAISSQEDLLKEIFEDLGWGPFPKLTEKEKASGLT